MTGNLRLHRNSIRRNCFHCRHSAIMYCDSPHASLVDGCDPECKYFVKHKSINK